MSTTVTIIVIGVISTVATIANGIRLALRERRRLNPAWEVRITTPDGTLVDVDTEALYFIWKYGGHSTDGYLDLLDGHRNGMHVWVKPAGWTEPDRTAALDGTAAAHRDLRWS